MMLTLITAVAFAHANDPFAAYAAFIKAHPAYQVHITASYNGGSNADGTILVQRPQRLLYKVHGAKFSYSLSLSEKGYTEIENSRRIYDEFDSPGRLAVSSSDISDLPNALLPRILLPPDLKFVFRKSATVTAAGSSWNIYEKDHTEMGMLELWATVDPEGHLVSARRKTTAMTGTRDFQWKFSDYAFPKSIGLSSFLTRVPPGYVPNSVPRLVTPLQAGQSAPVAGWGDGRKTVNLLEAAGHKPFLIAYVAPDSGPGEASLASLARLKSKLTVFMVGPKGLSDPGGTRLKALNPPGSPMFYLIDAKGKVAKLWFGYDREHSSAFESDVIAAMQGGATR